ncbi:MAG: hypothetical protein R3E83_07480 [Burkholderiaceae bacterium]
MVRIVYRLGDAAPDSELYPHGICDLRFSRPGRLSMQASRDGYSPGVSELWLDEDRCRLAGQGLTIVLRSD